MKKEGTTRSHGNTARLLWHLSVNDLKPKQVERFNGRCEKGSPAGDGPPTCVQAALVAVGAAQTEAAVAGVAALGEGRGGVDGVPPAAQHVSGIEELGVGHSLRKEGGVVRTWR